MRKYNPGQEQYIIKLFDITKGNATKASELYGRKYSGHSVSRPTIIRRWKGTFPDYVPAHGGTQHGRIQTGRKEIKLSEEMLQRVYEVYGQVRDYGILKQRFGKSERTLRKAVEFMEARARGLESKVEGK
jgi:hypothetical protein